MLMWVCQKLFQKLFKLCSRTTISEDVQTWFSVQLAFAKFLSRIKGNFQYSASIMDTALPQKFPFILHRTLAKANCSGNRVCTSCDTVVLDNALKNPPLTGIEDLHEAVLLLGVFVDGLVAAAVVVDALQEVVHRVVRLHVVVVGVGHLALLGTK